MGRAADQLPRGSNLHGSSLTQTLFSLDSVSNNLVDFHWRGDFDVAVRWCHLEGMERRP